MMAFFYVLDGKVHASGSDHLCRLMCQAVSLNDIIQQVGTEDKTKAPKQIDLRKLDMNIDWRHVKINALQHAYSQLTSQKDKERGPHIVSPTGLATGQKEYPFVPISKDKLMELEE